MNNVTDVTAPSGTVPMTNLAAPSALNVSKVTPQQGGKRLSKSIKDFLSCEPKRKFTLKKHGYKRKSRTRRNN